jgi:3-dehydroquinate synthase class II
MEQMTITNAKYVEDKDGNRINVKAIIDGDEMYVSIDPSNRHYAEIMRQVAAGELTIADAD